MFNMPNVLKPLEMILKCVLFKILWMKSKLLKLLYTFKRKFRKYWILVQIFLFLKSEITLDSIYVHSQCMLCKIKS